MEEIDLCWRLRSRGRGIVCIPQSCVYHVGGATLNKSNPRKTYLNFRNNLLMLYKNLPENELRPVMFVRAFLDYVAAFKSLLSGDAAGCCAVLQARRDFRRIKHDYSDLRRENLEKSVEADVKERTSFSILWKYYAGGRRLFSEL
jgi:GT2 family glycosyltransferase